MHRLLYADLSYTTVWRVSSSLRLYEPNSAIGTGISKIFHGLITIQNNI